MHIHTLTVVRLSNVKDLICPFSKNTFNTFGKSNKESSLSIVWKRSTKENTLHSVQILLHYWGKIKLLYTKRNEPDTHTHTHEWTIHRKSWDVLVISFLLGLTTLFSPCSLGKQKPAILIMSGTQWWDREQMSHVIMWPCGKEPAGLNKALQFGPKLNQSFPVVWFPPLFKIWWCHFSCEINLNRITNAFNCKCRFDTVSTNWTPFFQKYFDLLLWNNHLAKVTVQELSHVCCKPPKTTLTTCFHVAKAKLEGISSFPQPVVLVNTKQDGQHW